MVLQGMGVPTRLPRQPALCPAGLNNIILEHREIPSTNSWHTTLSTASPAHRTPWIFRERTSPAHPKHISDIRVYQAATPLALVLSQKSRKRRKAASPRPSSPGQPQNTLLGWGGSLGVPAEPQGPSGTPPDVSIHADWKAPPNVLPLPHPPCGFPLRKRRKHAAQGDTSVTSLCPTASPGHGTEPGATNHPWAEPHPPSLPILPGSSLGTASRSIGAAAWHRQL